MSREDRMRIVFMGTPDLAVPVLSALLCEGHELVGVYTRPDKPRGRGKRPEITAVREYALGRGLPVFQPASLRRDEEARSQLATLSPDLIVVAAYGLILPAETLGVPRLGCLNVHPSILPRYRGPSPVASAILQGDPLTGVTIMLMDEGMDSGPIVAQRETRIEPGETAEALTMRLFQNGAGLLVDILPEWKRGHIEVSAQDASKATFTKLLSREDGEVDWSRPAVWIARQVRAYHPWPGSYTYWRGRLLKILEASPVESGDETDAAPGVVARLSDGDLAVVTGEGLLELRRVQLEGRRTVSAREFVSGYSGILGNKLGRSR